ncbi:hypothetical protein T484DRAFT_1899497 [Baffinella frigidus]|nr:hypothetical protein T484DRAFT_1899497 [Cryptophyta sp. CCMP2293]
MAGPRGPSFAKNELTVIRSAQFVHHGQGEATGRSQTIGPSYQGSQSWSAGHHATRLAPDYLKDVHERPDQRRRPSTASIASSSNTSAAMLIGSATKGRRPPSAGRSRPHGSGALGLEQSRAAFAAGASRLRDAHNPSAVRSFQGAAPLPNAHWPEGMDAPPVRRDVETGRVLRNELTSNRRPASVQASTRKTARELQEFERRCLAARRLADEELQEFERRCLTARRLADESFGSGPMDRIDLGDSKNEMRRSCRGVSQGTQTEQGQLKALMMVHVQSKATDSWLYSSVDRRAVWRG